jgi:nucleotide-binding universal stress UspA family protein
MSYKSILVNLDIDGPVASLVRLAIDLAARFNARLIGFAAADAPLPIAVPESGAIAVEAWERQRKDIERRFAELRAETERLAAGSVEAEWRDALDSPTRALAKAASLADLIVTGATRGASTGDIYRAADPGSVVLQTGRPVLVAAGGAERVTAKKAVVAWKDTRESRRAVADAVPLLRLAEEVTVVTVDREPDQSAKAGVVDVASFLARHGIRARTEVIKAKDEGEKLVGFITSSHADLIVSGAYGHSRVREWVLGGVTRSLLDEVRLNRFMAS